MEAIWMGIAQGPHATRVLAMQGARTPLLKAKLLSDAAHPRALPTLLEAVALWYGIPVRAALVVDDERGSFGLEVDPVVSRVPETRAETAEMTG